MDAIKKFSKGLVTPFLDMSEVKRMDMPQIKDKDHEEAKLLLDEYSIPYEDIKIECSKLKPTQEDYSPEKLESMKDNILSGEFDPGPVFIAEDNSVLDGHHRWLALKEVYGKDHLMDATRINLPKIEALVLFDKMADKIDEIFSFKTKLTKEMIADFLTLVDLKGVINEANQSTAAEVDDGPATFYKNIYHYKSVVDPIAEQYGMKIINYIAGDKDDYVAPEGENVKFRYNIVDSISFFGVGVLPPFNEPTKDYIEFITPIAKNVGYEIIDFLMMPQLAKQEALTEARGKIIDSGIFKYIMEIKKGWYVEALNKKTKETVEAKVKDIKIKGSVKHYTLDNGKTINDKEWSINTLG